jgi:hypothetical protein
MAQKPTERMSVSFGSDSVVIRRDGSSAVLVAKELGRDRTQFYAAAMSAQLLEHMNLEVRLRRALGNSLVRAGQRIAAEASTPERTIEHLTPAGSR